MIDRYRLPEAQPAGEKINESEETEYRILGPIEVLRSGRPVPLAAPRQRALLAALLLEANRVVSVDRLTELLWGESPPAQARNTIQSLVLRLRRALTATGPTGGGEVLVTRRPGYLLRVAPGQLDLARFERLYASGRAALADGTPGAAARLLREALALWRGEPLADVAGVGLSEVEAPRLRELHLQALERRIEADLQLGHHGDLIAELPALIAEHPLRERLYGQLMLALYKAGRQAEALEVFHALRGRLVDEIGVDPGAELRGIHQAILRGEVDHPPPALVAAPAPHRPPAQLPLDVLGFAGRGSELAQLDTILAEAGKQAAAALISALSGTAGVGKTALAVHWAHRVREKFPDGQLYVNLRGFDPGGSVMSPAEAVRGFLDAFAVAPQRIPDSFDAQAALYRSLLAGKRVLVLLDNARDAEQVRPLLPGAPGCVALVTSRSHLSGLVATVGARSVTLGLLSLDESREMLGNRLGVHRVAAEPAATEEIIARSARLPLALAIVAARATTHPGFTLATLAAELHRARTFLDAFAGEDPVTNVRAVFSWSYHTLSPAAARLFRLLGLHPGPDVGMAAAASLAGLPPERVRPALAELTRAHLLTEHAPDRFAFHDLLRAYATELTNTRDTDDERRVAANRVLDHYLHSAHGANRLLLHPHLEPIAVTPAHAGVTPEELADHRAALAWFTVEYPVLLAAIRQAGAAGFDTHCWQLAWTLIPFLNRRGLWQVQAATQQAALDAARRRTDLAGQAQSHRGLGGAYIQLARHDDANTEFLQALDLFRRLADPNGQASAHFGLGALCGRRGRHRDALGHAQHALDLHRSAGHRAGQASALNTIGWYHAQLGDHRQALAHCQQALSLHSEVGDRHGEAITWDSLGYAHHQLGDHQQAITCYEQAVDLLRELDDRYTQADTLTHLGDAHRAAGDLDAARTAWHEALALLDGLEHPDAAQVRARLHRFAQPRRAPTTSA